MRSFVLAALSAATLISSAPSWASATKAEAAFQPARFSVVVEGTGPDVILIPGLSSTRDVWTASAARLKASHRVHLVQVKGFGEPAGINASGPVLKPFVDELAQYIRSNRLRAPKIIGHSMGGLAALMLAADSPDLPGKIMIVDAFPFIGPVFGVKDVAEITPGAEQMRTMLIASAATVTPDFATLANCTSNALPPAAPAGVMSNSALGQCMMKHGAKASDLRVVAQAMYDDMITDVRPRLKAIKAPVTMLYPQDDRLLTAAQAAKLYGDAYAGTPTIRLVPIAGSYHFIMQDQPEAFDEQLQAFLRGKSGS